MQRGGAMRKRYGIVCAAGFAASIVGATLGTCRAQTAGYRAVLDRPLVPYHPSTRRKHVYYGVGGAKHQTTTGGPVGGITSRN